MEEKFEKKWKKLEHKLGYVFQDKSLLQCALTRESAVQEKIPGAAGRSYQALEFVGDAALKYGIGRLLFQKYGNEWTEAQFHDATTKLIGNEEVLPQIADQLELSQFIMCGKGEKVLTPNMKADMLEALIGAIAMDNKKQVGLINVIERLWNPYLKASEKKAEIAKAEIARAEDVKKAPSPTVVNSSRSASHVKVVETLNSPPSPPSPRTQRLFTGLASNTPLELFESFVKEASDVNRRNVGEKGDTPLMKLMRRKPLTPENDIPKVVLLLAAGASWTAENNKGETAASIAKMKKHNIAQFKK